MQQPTQQQICNQHTPDMDQGITLDRVPGPDLCSSRFTAAACRSPLTGQLRCLSQV